MKEGLHPGKTSAFSIRVDPAMVAAFDGEVIHPVLSTVMMIYYMEKAGRQVILPYLEEWEEGAGLAVDVKHIAPAVVGQKVRFQATCIEATNKRVVCEVMAETDLHLIGKGTFVQAIFFKEEMEEKIRRIEEVVQRRDGGEDWSPSIHA